MSSKRKNTPTKLSKDEVLIHREHIENGSDGDSHNESDCDDSDSSLSLHIVSKPEQLDDLTDGADSPASLDRPQTKKQRLLQSVKCDNESDNDTELSYHNNNNILTKPTTGLIMNSRKSMDSVLRRLNHKAEMKDLTVQNGGPEDETQVMDSIKAAISTTDSVEDKEKKLAEMIAQLQSMKERLSTEKSIQVSRSLL